MDIEAAYNRVLAISVALQLYDGSTQSKKFAFLWNDAAALLGTLVDNKTLSKKPYPGPDLEVVQKFGDFSTAEERKSTMERVAAKRMEHLEALYKML